MDIKIQLRSQMDEALATSSLQTSLEQTRGHLQRQLRQREADCNRMAVQIRSLESELAQEKIEVDHLQELLRQAHHKHEKDKDALKKATRYDNSSLKYARWRCWFGDMDGMDGEDGGVGWGLEAWTG